MQKFHRLGETRNGCEGLTSQTSITTNPKMVAEFTLAFFAGSRIAPLPAQVAWIEKYQ
jgi:hypothetical protein